ncbi:MAG: C1 family peptidase [Bacteroides sp.]|nr:C1 family peptidase [Bacteroides sp.]MCM1379774.1 C1 family peptidase [Bacteroides sp.]MCM1445685.1 C1 family peptidase [Prevotella sp.]
MKSVITSAAALAIALGGFAQETADTTKSAPKGFVFTDVITIPSTSVKDQNKSGTCWSFSGTGFIEDYVRKTKGDSLDLSEMYTVRQCYLDKARRHVLLQGHGNVGEGGSIVDVAYVMSNYGAIPEEAYKGLNYGEAKHDHSELARAIRAYMGAITAGRKTTTAWEEGLTGILDAYLGKVPETFEYQGKTYTPKSFAEYLGINEEEFIAFTSFTHHPYWKPFALEVCDNWLWAPYQNVPLDVMQQIIDNALENGYTVNWAADVSEDNGFKWKQGYAVLPAKKNEANLEGTELSRWVKLSDADREKEAYNFTGPDDLVEVNVTPEERQRMFENHETTDDHGMVIVGTATDQTGNKFYKVKNSWDTNHVYNGYFYVSVPYLLGKTMSFMVHKDALPKDVKKNLNIK